MDQQHQSRNFDGSNRADPGRSHSTDEPLAFTSQPNTTRIPAPTRNDLFYLMTEAEKDAPATHRIVWYTDGGIQLVLSVAYSDSNEEFPSWKMTVGEEPVQRVLFTVQSINPDDLILRIMKIQPTLDEPVGVTEKDPSQISSQLAAQDMQRGELKKGSVFAGRYKIISQMGQGGMGCVYQVSDLLEHKTVALKVLHSHLIDDENAKARFQREARATVFMSHPNVLCGYDFGISTEQGLPYIAMELISGIGLNQILRMDGPLEVKRFVSIFAQACIGLDHAHSRNIIHRDVKPSNIMLIQFEGNNNFVKLVDFGIAKFINANAESPSQCVTRGGHVFGSPSYMSPEQCMGKELDARSDIYGLGCVMYEALTGVRLFDAQNPLSIMQMHVSQLPLAFSVVSPEIFIPEELEAIIMKCLKKKPDERYHSVRFIGQELEQFLVDLGARSPNGQGHEESNNETRMLEFLRTCELITTMEHSHALRVAKDGRYDVRDFLRKKCSITPATVSAAMECQEMVLEGKCNMELAVIAVHYCHKNKVSLKEAFLQLGFAISP